MIGLYVVRCSDSGAAVTLAHLVESEIEDRLVSRCGHQMHRRNKQGALRMAGGMDRTCHWCAAKRDARVEDVPEPTATEQDDYDGAAV